MQKVEFVEIAGVIRAARMHGRRTVLVARSPQPPMVVEGRCSRCNGLALPTPDGKLVPSCACPPLSMKWVPWRTGEAKRDLEEQ